MEKKYYAMRLWDMQTMIHCSLFFFFLGGLATISYYRNIYQEVASSNLKGTRTTIITNGNTNANTTTAFDHQSKLKIEQPSSMGTCDLYKENECPYLDDTFACQTYGRNESKYLQWRWKPHACEFPTFVSFTLSRNINSK